MAKVGYLMRFAGYDGADADIEWMKRFGCIEIVEEQPEDERLRPGWDKLLNCLEYRDELVVPKLSNVLRGSRQLAFFLEFCRIKAIRLVSIHDRIDSDNSLFPETKTSDILATFALLPKEVNANRKSSSHARKLKGRIKVLSQAAYNRSERSKLIINMYNGGHTIDDIWKASGFSSRSSVFRVLNDAGIKLNRSNRDYHPDVKKEKPQE